MRWLVGLVWTVCSTQENPHRPKSMVGYCTGLEAGDHKVGVWQFHDLPGVTAVVVSDMRKTGWSADLLACPSVSVKTRSLR